MFACDEWLGARLTPLAPGALRHRRLARVVDKLPPAAGVRFFSVPLASGISEAVLLSPKNPLATRRSLVILLHGLGDDCVFPQWHWAQALVARGIPVLSVSWDGHGVIGGSVLDVASASRSLPILLQRLYSGPGESAIGNEHPKCFLMGNSFGATLALVAASRPEAVQALSGVVAVSPMVAVDVARWQTRECLSKFAPYHFFHDVLPRCRLYGLDAFERKTGVYKKVAANVRMRVGVDPLDQVRAFLTENIERRQLLRMVKTPVLWLHGVRDRIAPLDRALPFMREIPSAMFSHFDDRRGHRLMALSADVPEYAARFVERCIDLDASATDRSDCGGGK